MTELGQQCGSLGEQQQQQRGLVVRHKRWERRRYERREFAGQQEQLGEQQGLKDDREIDAASIVVSASSPLRTPEKYLQA